MNSEKKMVSVKKNFIMNIILTASTFVFPLITFPYVSRTLHADGIGKVSFASSLVAYFLMFSQLGIPVYGIRVCAQVRDDKKELSKVTHELFLINLITTIVVYFAFALTMCFVTKVRNEAKLMMVMSSTIMLATIGIEWFYKAIEQYTYITIRSLVFKVISVICLFLFVHKEDDYVAYAAVTVIATSGSYLLNVLNARKYVEIRPMANYRLVRHIKPMLLFFAMACATTIYTNLDRVMLGFMTTDADVGYYDVAIRLKGILTSVVVSLGTVLLPRTSYFVQNKRYEEFYALCNKAINFVFVISIPLIVYCSFFAGRIISLLAGNGFEESGLVALVLMPTIFLIGLNNILAIQMLVPLGKEIIVLYAEIAGAIVDVVLNIILIPVFKSSGAAIGTLVAEIVVTSICYWVLRKETNPGFRNIEYGKIFVSLGIAFISIVWAFFYSLGDFVTLLLTSIAFFGTYVLLMYVLKEKLIFDVINQVKLRALGLKS